MLNYEVVYLKLKKIITNIYFLYCENKIVGIRWVREKVVC